MIGMFSIMGVFSFQYCKNYRPLRKTYSFVRSSFSLKGWSCLLYTSLLHLLRLIFHDSFPLENVSFWWSSGDEMFYGIMLLSTHNLKIFPSIFDKISFQHASILVMQAILSSLIFRLTVLAFVRQGPGPNIKTLVFWEKFSIH